jgi:hypothetical protein
MSVTRRETAVSHECMGLKDKLNPLGQRTPSGKVGATNPRFKHGQSAELVEEVRRKADKEQGKGTKPNKSSDYDVTSHDRQPGKIARQSDLGKKPRQKQLGQYTQDNEEEEPLV